MLRSGASSHSVPSPLSIVGAGAGLRPQHFTRLAKIIEGAVGIQLPLSKQSMVEGRLTKRMRANGFHALLDYGDYLFDHGGLDSEIEALIDCITTNKTDFFREPDHFDFLGRVALPDLIALPNRGHGPLKIWSAACSNGAEAYTAAMVLHMAMEGRHKMGFLVLGTDIDRPILEEAQRAIYRVPFIAPIPEHFCNRYLMKGLDPARNVVRVAPELRRFVRFERLNLMDRHYTLDRDIDVIFCRNVLIYFDDSVQKAVVERLTSHLRPGGFLMLGHSESAVGNNVTGLEQIKASIFQRTKASTDAGSDIR